MLPIPAAALVRGREIGHLVAAGEALSDEQARQQCHSVVGVQSLWNLWTIVRTFPEDSIYRILKLYKILIIRNTNAIRNEKRTLSTDRTASSSGVVSNVESMTIRL